MKSYKAIGRFLRLSLNKIQRCSNKNCLAMSVPLFICPNDEFYDDKYIKITVNRREADSVTGDCSLAQIKMETLFSFASGTSYARKILPVEILTIVFIGHSLAFTNSYRANMIRLFISSTRVHRRQTITSQVNSPTTVSY
jgi:hypothetical protein